MTVFFIVAIVAFKHFNLFGVTKLEFDSLQPHPILQMVMYRGSPSPVASLYREEFSFSCCPYSCSQSQH